ncbi:molybdate ABC transporter substrate-binding protein [Primorskyibacter sp. 2E107]|uniref:molybdate ABC transporter substrate-binding protein n=1 Tax=Primorskyibacter sp. 2E107 TaxID=3403458 RepID=UPI003AF95228
MRKGRDLGYLRFICLCVALVGAAGVASAERITVFAAASLKTALDEIGPLFEADTGHDLVVSLAGSSALARQIEHGAPADVFISANVGWMDHIAALGLLEPGTRRDVLGNTLVLVGQGAALDDWADLPGRLGAGRLAMALVEAVPAGIYGKDALMSLGLWSDVETRVAQVDNVRAALALVALGEAPMGVVYATDAAAEPAVAVLADFPAGSHQPILYPAARIAGSGAAADDFLTYLQSAEARAVFEAQGFTVLED